MPIRTLFIKTETVSNINSHQQKLTADLNLVWGHTIFTFDVIVATDLPTASSRLRSGGIPFNLVIVEDDFLMPSSTTSMPPDEPTVLEFLRDAAGLPFVIILNHRIRPQYPPWLSVFPPIDSHIIPDYLTRIRCKEFVDGGCSLIELSHTIAKAIARQ